MNRRFFLRQGWPWVLKIANDLRAFRILRVHFFFVLITLGDEKSPSQRPNFLVIHPRKLTAGSQKLMVWVDVFPLPLGAFFRFHVSFQGCISWLTFQKVFQRKAEDFGLQIEAAFFAL